MLSMWIIGLFLILYYMLFVYVYTSFSKIESWFFCPVWWSKRICNSSESAISVFRVCFILVQICDREKQFPKSLHLLWYMFGLPRGEAQITGTFKFLLFFWGWEKLFDYYFVRYVMRIWCVSSIEMKLSS